MSDNNKNRCFTVMIVPHSEEATYSLRIPLYLVQAVVALLVIGVTGFCVLGYAYLRASAEARESETLRQLSRAQQEEINALAVETERMMEQVDAVDELVELVTEKLELDEGEVGDVLQNQSAASNGAQTSDYNEQDFNGSTPMLTQTAVEVDTLRSYDSRSAGLDSSNGIVERATDNLSVLQGVIPDQVETLDVVGDYIDRSEAKPLMWPVKGRIISGFGVRAIPYANSGYQFHTGVDIVGSRDASIKATAPGEVIFASYRGSFGKLVIIEHGYEYQTHYAHLSDFAVSVGDEVEKGQTVGYMGATGRTTGTHLHYEVHHNGSPVNPSNYLKER
ncbi:MAG: M23 family metallopeptidase [Bacillota bacterium]